MNATIKTFIRSALACAWSRMCADRENLAQLESRAAQLAIDIQRAKDALTRSEAAHAALEAQADEIDKIGA